MKSLLKGFFHYRNIWRHPVSSLIGIVILVMVGRKYYLTHTLDDNDFLLIAFGLGSPFAKDPSNAGGTVSIIIITVLMLLLNSCVTVRKCLDKFGGEMQTITVYDTLRDTVRVADPGGELAGGIDLDSLRMLLQGEIDSLKFTSEDKQREAKFWHDKYAKQLGFKCIEKPDTVEVIREVPIEVKADCPPAVVVDPEQALRWYEKIWKGFQFFSALLVLAGFAFVSIWVIVNAAARRSFPF